MSSAPAFGWSARACSGAGLTGAGPTGPWLVGAGLTTGGAASGARACSELDSRASWLAHPTASRSAKTQRGLERARVLMARQDSGLAARCAPDSRASASLRGVLAPARPPHGSRIYFGTMAPGPRWILFAILLLALGLRACGLTFGLDRNDPDQTQFSL